LNTLSVVELITGLELECLIDSEGFKGWFIPEEESATHALSAEIT